MRRFFRFGFIFQFFSSLFLRSVQSINRHSDSTAFFKSYSSKITSNMSDSYLSNLQITLNNISFNSLFHNIPPQISTEIIIPY